MVDMICEVSLHPTKKISTAAEVHVTETLTSDWEGPSMDWSKSVP